MKKIYLLLILNLSLIASTVTHVQFESGISFYGKVGEISLIFEEDNINNYYKMNVVVSSTGFLKAISNNRVETLLSEGIIKDGVYIPQTYIKKVTKNGYEKLITYKFDYISNNIKSSTIKKESIITTQFNHKNFKFIEQEKIINTKKTKKLKMYRNDFLTLYLNWQHKNLKNKQHIRYLGQKSKDFISLLNQKSFSINKNNNEYEIIVDVLYDNQSVFFKKATSKLFYYGDAYVKKISETSYIQ